MLRGLLLCPSQGFGCEGERGEDSDLWLLCLSCCSSFHTTDKCCRSFSVTDRWHVRVFSYSHMLSPPQTLRANTHCTDSALEMTSETSQWAVKLFLLLEAVSKKRNLKTEREQLIETSCEIRCGWKEEWGWLWASFPLWLNLKIWKFLRVFQVFFCELCRNDAEDRRGSESMKRKVDTHFYTSFV